LPLDRGSRPAAESEEKAAAEANWVPARSRLRFTFGEYCFHEAWFEGLELLSHVTRIKVPLEETTAAIIPLLLHQAVISIPSHPVSEPPSRLELSRRFIRYVPATNNHYYVELDGSFEEYLGACRDDVATRFSASCDATSSLAAGRSSSHATQARKTLTPFFRPGP